MSTLSIPAPRSAESDVDTRFDALVRSVVPAQRSSAADVDFETVFDLDYGQPVEEPVAPVVRPAARVRQGQGVPSRAARPADAPCG